MKLEYTVLIERDEDGIYCTSVPLLPGCFSNGKTVDEALVHTKEAIELYIEVLVEKKEHVPIEFETAKVEVDAEVATPQTA